MANKKHRVEVENRLIDQLHTSGWNRRMFERAPIEPLVCPVEFPDIEAGKVTVSKHELVVYREKDSEHWTTNYEDVTRYTRRNKK